ncbi:hypothetical protein HDU93_009197 [Gonapodya sp. JEL0774]|nr:hypothetical protein HDU93_009197 [Gonapodya sp. JEL0774]
MEDATNLFRLGFSLAKKPRLECLPIFSTVRVEQRELSRRGSATPIQLRDRTFVRYLPWSARQDSQSSAGTSNLDSYTNILVGAHLTLTLNWNRARRSSHIIPAYRNIDNLLSLATDAAESALQRRLTVIPHTLVTTPSGTCTHSVESLARALKIQRLYVQRGSSPLRWNGSVVPDVKAAALSVCCHHELRGMELGGWTGLERLKVEASNGEASMASLLSGQAMQPGGSHLADLDLKTRRGKFQDPLGLCLLIPSLINLTHLQVTNWHFPSNSVPDSEFSLLYDTFVSLPSKLPNLVSFGDVLYWQDRLSTQSAKGGYDKLEQVGLRLYGPTSGNMNMASQWKGAGLDIANACPNIRSLRAVGDFGADTAECMRTLAQSMASGELRCKKLTKIIFSVHPDDIEVVRDSVVPGVSGIEITAEVAPQLWEHEDESP